MDEVTLREQRELRDTVGDWLNKLTDDEWKPFTVTETGYRPFTANDEALSKLIGGDGCVEMRFGVCVYDAECPDNEERSLVIWLEGTGLGFQSLHNIRERVRPQWLNAFQTDGHCHGSPTVKHEDDYSVVLEPDVWLKLTNKGVKAKQAILNGDVETTLKRICRHGEFANEPEAERRLNVLPTEPASDATELPSVPNHSD
ncbi:MAG: hypothetical protein HQ518_11995, partial [Rhodopirellula sp.]|nr:hypothetical protein [Rhodopirellula sp.]